MSTNCLVTTLVGSVNNPNLEKLGKLTLYVKSGTISNTNQQRFGFTTNGTTTLLKALGGGYFATTPQLIETDKTTSRPLTDNISVLYFKAADYTLEVENKYCLTILRGGGAANSIISINLDSLSGCTNLIEVGVNNTSSFGNISVLRTMTNLLKLALANTNVEGDIANLFGLNLQEFSSAGSGIYGDIVALKDMTNLREFSFNDLMFGDIANLAKCTALTGCYFGASHISGTLESFVAGQISNGRTTPSAPFIVSNLLPKVTFGGKNFSDSNTYLDWESATKIGVMVGSASTPTKVYYSGYTPAEAATKWSNVSAGNLIKVDA